ncbi:MAG: ferrochelatase [Planctomycetaceae bacterium]|nr:ferrochelatase [Planctomycetaceae bacterium]
MSENYDAVLFVSFGGPEGQADVMPFLENVLRGRNVPHERMLEVSKHYKQFDGISPINNQNRALIKALTQELEQHGPQLPIYWGNRNWHPMLGDTLQQMTNDGVKRALAFVTSAYSCYSGCRQYREDIQKAQESVTGTAPVVDKIRVFYNHPSYVETMVERVSDAMEKFPAERRGEIKLLFTAHSIPLAMSDGSRYVEQLQESCRLVSEQLQHSDWELVYQSRSGPPHQPWLEPDICDHLQKIHDDQGVRDVIIVPIGFISDHMEVLFDLDTEAHELCDQLGMNLVRAATAGIHPKFVSMIRELIAERLDDGLERRFLGTDGPSHDICPLDCCLSGRPARRPTS